MNIVTQAFAGHLGNLELAAITISSGVIVGFNFGLLYNKLPSFSQIPLWISCDLEGNDEDMTNGELINSSVEMDVLESTVTDLHGDSNIGSTSSSGHLTGSSPNRCFTARKLRKGWKRRYYLQQRARQERLNCSRKWKGEESAHVSTQSAATENCESCNASIPSASLVMSMVIWITKYGLLQMARVGIHFLI